MLGMLGIVRSVNRGRKNALDLMARCKYIPKADPEMDPNSIRASGELYFSARTTSSLRQSSSQISKSANQDPPKDYSTSAESGFFLKY